MSRRIDDLTWFFCGAESALGLSSNFSAILAMGFKGASASLCVEPISDGQIDAATRYRKTKTRLARCSAKAQRVLRAAYSHSVQHPQLAARDALGELAPVVLLDHGQAELLSLVARGEAAVLADIRSKARLALSLAEREFLAITQPQRPASEVA